MRLDEKELFLTPNQAAKLLNVSLVTLKKLIRLGQLKAITTPGGHHRIYKHQLMSFAGLGSVETSTSVSSSDDLLFDLTENFMRIIETRQKFCKNHSAAVSRLSGEIGRHLGLSESPLRELKLASLLHDVGKFHVSQEILNKPGRLTDDEYSLVKRHCHLGREILRSVTPFTCVADIISQHHERFDGSGYPQGLKGENISIEARVIALADSFDAMTSSTSYKKARTTEDAFQELKNNAGTQFDPRVVDTFLAIQRNI